MRRRTARVLAAVLCLVVLWLLYRMTRPGPAPPGSPRPAYIQAPQRPVTSRQGERIPRIIHQTWKTEQVPYQFQKWMRTWVTKHPDWQYWFWTDVTMRNLVAARQPALLSLYDSYPAAGYRADAFRYVALHEYGGVYADLDLEVLRPLDAWLARACFLAQEPLFHAHFLSPLGPPLVSNALMGCAPRHALMAHVIRDLHKYAGFLWWWNDILRATGPYMLTEVYRGGGSHWSRAEGVADVELAAPEVFQPTLDNSMLDRIRQMCLYSSGHSFLSKSYSQRQQQLCKELLGNNFQNRPTERSLTDHHWTHSWAGPLNDPWGIGNSHKTFNISDLTRTRPLDT